MSPTQDQACAAGPALARGTLHLLVGRARRWVLLNVWCSHLYRPAMRLLHRFNLHYAPPSPMSPQYGKRDHWCQWCGLRGNTWTHDPDAPLMPIEPNAEHDAGGRSEANDD